MQQGHDGHNNLSGMKGKVALWDCDVTGFTSSSNKLVPCADKSSVQEVLMILQLIRLVFPLFLVASWSQKLKDGLRTATCLLRNISRKLTISVRELKSRLETEDLNRRCCAQGLIYIKCTVGVFYSVEITPCFSASCPVSKGDINQVYDEAIL